MTDDDVEKIIKRNMNLQMNLAGIRKDFEEAQQRTWVGLNDEDRRLIRKWTTYNQFMTAGEYAEAVQIATEEKLKELNA